MLATVLVMMACCSIRVTAQEAETFELQVGARTCGAADEVGNTCQPYDGVVIVITDANDTYIGECTTAPYDGAGSMCTVPVPLGSTVTASVSEAYIPANHTMSAKNRTVTVPSDPGASQDAVPTFEFWDDALLEQTVVPEDPPTDEPLDEQPAEEEPAADSGGTRAGESSGEPINAAQDQPAEAIDDQSADTRETLTRFLDDWGVLIALGAGIVLVLAVSIRLMRGGK